MYLLLLKLLSHHCHSRKDISKCTSSSFTVITAQVLKPNLMSYSKQELSQVSFFRRARQTDTVVPRQADSYTTPCSIFLKYTKRQYHFRRRQVSFFRHALQTDTVVPDVFVSVQCLAKLTVTRRCVPYF